MNYQFLQSRRAGNIQPTFNLCSNTLYLVYTYRLRSLNITAWWALSLWPFSRLTVFRTNWLKGLPKVFTFKTNLKNTFAPLWLCKQFSCPLLPVLDPLSCQFLVRCKISWLDDFSLFQKTSYFRTSCKMPTPCINARYLALFDPLPSGQALLLQGDDRPSLPLLLQRHSFSCKTLLRLPQSLQVMSWLWLQGSW